MYLVAIIGPSLYTLIRSIAPLGYVNIWVLEHEQNGDRVSLYGHGSGTHYKFHTLITALSPPRYDAIMFTHTENVINIEVATGHIETNALG